MLNGLDLFSGIGGISLALSEWVRPVAYCENERYAQGILLSRMASGDIPIAPIWDDVTTLKGKQFKGGVDIIYGGFPCQDISVAGAGKGLEGERSGLFYEIMRLVDEIQPTFIFLENVPAITTRGLGTVAAEITKRRYDCRWRIISAAEVGAPHLRKRWWLLGYSNNKRKSTLPKHDETSGVQSSITNAMCELIRQQSGGGSRSQGESKTESGDNGKEESLAHASGERLQRQWEESRRACKEHEDTSNSCWWATEPDVGRVANGIPRRVDRIKGLGNAVVPQQAREAFMILSGLNI